MAKDIEDSLKRDLILTSKGVSGSFDFVVATAAPLVRGFARRYFDNDACDDVVQEVFIQVFRSIKRYNPKLSAKSWILGITHHVIVDEIRRRTRRPTRSGEDLNLAAAVAQDTSEIEDLILRLPKDYFDVIYATKIVGLSYEETAQSLSIPVGTVKSRIFAARKELSQMIYDADASQSRGQSSFRDLA
ncbi:MAG: RNA polymerase sigma factor [Actinomycetota bacterium]|nr:RNA polymerase sigma factor [Actinomycetota bacterium]